MTKSRSQTQKEYRERKKRNEGDNYLKKESRRVLRYYVPANELNERERKKRNAVARIRNQTHRKKLKLQKRVLTEDSSAYNSLGTPLIVRLPSLNKGSGRGYGGKRKYSRALARAYKSIKSLKEENVKFLRKYKAKSRQYDRLKKKVGTCIVNAEVSKNTGSRTPKKTTDAEMTGLDLTPKRRNKVRRKLLQKNVLLREISEARNATTSRYDRFALARIVSGKILKKYRCLRATSNGTGICRRTLKKSGNKNVRSDRRLPIVKKFSATVAEFMSREDNSRTQPGKSDAVKGLDGEKKQTKVLTDYLSNLHKKFCAEKPEIKISLATFCRLRPKHILTAKFVSRTSCLCIKHQNISLLCQSLRKYGISISENPEKQLPVDEWRGEWCFWSSWDISIVNNFSHVCQAKMCSI